MIGTGTRSRSAPIRVVLADDHGLVRAGLRALLAAEPGVDVIGTASDGLEAVRLARELQPDVLVTDVSMPGLNGIEAIRRIHAEQPAVRTLCLSMHDTSRMVLAALDAGASGYVLKEGSGEELGQAIRQVMAHKVYLSPELVGVVVGEMRQRQLRPADKPGAAEAALTPRERELVQLLSEGYSTADVAERLHVSVKTVGSHREHVMHKLGLHSVAELTRYALREGLTSLDTPCGEAQRRRSPGAR
jgi:DNA-binding NarL/FixJ family response regulator